MDQQDGAVDIFIPQSFVLSRGLSHLLKIEQNAIFVEIRSARPGGCHDRDESQYYKTPLYHTLVLLYHFVSFLGSCITRAERRVTSLRGRNRIPKGAILFIAPCITTG